MKKFWMWCSYHSPDYDGKTWTGTNGGGATSSNIWPCCLPPEDQCSCHCWVRYALWSISFSNAQPDLVYINILKATIPLDNDNPCDLHDPIAQIFAGKYINLDNFIATLGLNKSQHAKNIAADLYAAAKFFHFIINTIFKTLFQIKVTSHHVQSQMGILSCISADFSTVESQGWGTLHLHLLIWLKHAPSFDEIHEFLQSEEFHAWVVAYIHANLWAYLPALESAESMKSLPRDKEIAYNWPPKPDMPNYEHHLHTFELQLARAEQVHTCKVHWCLLPDKHGCLRCKQKVPFQCAVDDFVMEAGKWGPKWLDGFINGWVPGILINARCNNNGKLLTNGADTKNITFYVTVYAAMKQRKIFNTLAVLTQGFAHNHDHPNVKYLDSIQDGQQLLLFWIVQGINCEQELAAPIIISYLMGWDDVFRSHSYSVIYWSSFVSALLKYFPDLHVYNRQVFWLEVSCSNWLNSGSFSSNKVTQHGFNLSSVEWVQILWQAGKVDHFFLFLATMTTPREG